MNMQRTITQPQKKSQQNRVEINGIYCVLVKEVMRNSKRMVFAGIRICHTCWHLTPGSFWKCAQAMRDDVHRLSLAEPVPRMISPLHAKTVPVKAAAILTTQVRTRAHIGINACIHMYVCLITAKTITKPFAFCGNMIVYLHRLSFSTLPWRS